MNISRSSTLIGLVALASVAYTAPKVEFASDSILIKTNGNFQPQLTDIAFGTSPSSDLGIAGWRKVTIPRSATVNSALAYYKNAPGVLAVEHNFIARALGLPNDPAL